MADDEKDVKKHSALGDVVKAESMVQIAIMLPACCLLGWLGGAALDRHFHQNWIGIVGIFVGAVAGFVQIVKTAAKFLKRDS
jgi:F0F1-type ATP synthase assembly protein I